MDEKFFESQKKPEKNHLLSSFYYAFSGIVEGIKSERNMMIHYFALCMVVVFGITLKLSVTEWCICLILCAIVISLELMNTAIECVVDLVTEEYDQKAKKAKDMAAGAVLVAAAVAALIGGFIFLPKIIALFT
ncbi:MAG: diacylglycerol kinase family protein [Hespellia sp.]|nr:diacylglycerol kinase family protein [Hespellia sp.]